MKLLETIIQFKNQTLKTKKMEGLIWDSVPAQRKRKEELFSFPVVTLSAIAKLGAGRKFSFNAAAQKHLDIKGGDRVSFGFSSDKTIAAVRKASGDQGFALTQTCSVSDKKTYEYVVKMFNLNTEIENHFSITNENGLDVLTLLGNTEAAPNMPEMVEETVYDFAVTNVGEISDEEDLSADLRGIPTTESFGIAAAEEVEEVATMLQPTQEGDSEEESVW